MGLTLFWTMHLAFSVFAAAAGTACAVSPTRWKGAWSIAVLAIVPLLVLHTYLTFRALELRFESGVEHAPWLFSSSLLVFHAVVSAWLVWRARNGATLFGWTVARLALACFLAFGFGVTTLRVLDLEARLALSNLGVEAGRIAYELAPAAPDDATNAALVYERVADTLFEGDNFIELDPFEPALSGKSALDANDPKLREILKRCAGAIDEVRLASTLPHCRFSIGEQSEFVVVPKILPLIRTVRLLELSALVRAHDGDIAGAIDDVLASMRVSEHVVRTPSLLGLAAGSVLRNETITTLLHVVASEKVDDADLARFDALLAVPFVRFASSATRMEEAWGLALLGSTLGDGTSRFFGIGEVPFEWTGTVLYAPFLMTEDVRGYREIMGELQTLAHASRRELVNAADDDASKERVRRRGVLSLLMAPNVVRILMQVHNADARAELARLALAAAREKRSTGSFPTAFGAWSGAVTDVRIESDGATIVLSRTEADELGNPLEVSLPPRLED